MPEGHTIHRLARRHREALAGSSVATSSPQGRFATGARRLNGRVLESVDPVGKHLFYHWEGAETLHVHLGLFGKFRLHRGDQPPPPSVNTRLTMAREGVIIYLAGPTICELIDPEAEVAIRSRLGPDPLARRDRGKRLERFQANLRRRQIPIGAALLDQRVIAGIGNVYRAEILFRTGVDPHLSAREVSPVASEHLWTEASTLLAAGARAGRIITVDPEELGARRVGDLERDERLYVYGRTGEPCRRCRTQIATSVMGGRSIWWCPSCQPAGAGRAG